ncbi:MAG: peptidoglycan DD-metalloendopeptidase family protein [Bacteroidetes bacterium]|nr:peptidoglycan DD-metalloendopeptidase family protein [Bacteroidota bacterium]
MRTSVWAIFCIGWMNWTGCSGSDGSSGPSEVVNTAPVFTSEAPTTKLHNQPFEYAIEVSDNDGDPITLTAPVLPFWMTFDTESNTLTGELGWGRIGTHPIVLRASDGHLFNQQSFTLTVQRAEITCQQPFGDPTASPYILPYATGKTYTVFQSYCPENPAWGHRNWFAYDFDTQMGDQISASRGGVVIAVRQDNPDIPSCAGGKENFVFILHSDGTVMQYMHLQQNGVLVTAGQQVVAGQALGRSGNSGCSSGPHLHVALFRNNTNYDRQSSLPFNYSNAEGTLDANNALMQQGAYLAK